MHLNANKAGLAFGAFLALVHLVWSILVLLSWGQPIYDFILWAHMIHLPLVIGPFDITAAVTLVVLTAIIGYVMGYVFAILWNKVHKV